jgi:uncharacterized protein
MGLVSDLLASVADAPALTVQRAVVGPRFFGIALGESSTSGTMDAHWTGVAFLGQHQRPAGDVIEQTLQSTQGLPAAEVAGWLREGDGGDVPKETLARSAIGAATLNALLAQQRASRGTALGDENGLDVMAQAAVGKRLAVIGGFPYLDEIRAKTTQSWILELDPDDEHTPASAAPEVLPQADVVGVTGSALANGTLEGVLKLCRPDAFVVLKLCRPDAFVVLIGPTSPMSPVLFKHGAKALCGISIPSEETERVFAAIVQEGSTRRIPGTRPISLRP